MFISEIIFCFHHCTVLASMLVTRPRIICLDLCMYYLLDFGIYTTRFDLSRSEN